MSLDIDLLRNASRHRMGDIVSALGAEKVIGTAARGRATCPVHRGNDLNASYGNGFLTCFSGCGGATFDALALVAATRGLDLKRREDLAEAASELAAILGIRLEDRAVARSWRPTRAGPASEESSAPTSTFQNLWEQLTLTDTAGEAYLASRKLLGNPALDDLVRFNRSSEHEWLAAREREGYVVVFPVRKPDGTIVGLSVRHVGPGKPPEWWQGKTKLTVKGSCPRGAAICRPGIRYLASGDPEFDKDEIVICEGGTDVLAVTLAWDLGSIEGQVAPAWAIGAVGVGMAPAMVRAFASVIRGRTVHVAIDVDAAGMAKGPETVAAAWECGARRVTRIWPPAGKDMADGWLAHE